MAEKEAQKVHVPNKRSIELLRQKDGEIFYVHCTGGFRAAEIDDDKWAIEPIYEGGRVYTKGFLSKTEFWTLISKCGLLPIAIERLGWYQGAHYSSWSPIIPGRTNHMRSPADLWISIASNSWDERVGTNLENLIDPTRESVAALIDDQIPLESYAQFIGQSLRSMDVSVQQIVEFYNEQLVDLLASRKMDGNWVSKSAYLEQTLKAHVHSFFVHFGSARDYLASFITARIGRHKRLDSMTRLLAELSDEDFDSDGLLAQLKTLGYVRRSSKKRTNWEVSGWLEEASVLRDKFVHRRPYGSRFVEQSGRAIPIDAESGLYRYFRPIHDDINAENDLLDLVVRHYKQTTQLFQNMAETSGGDISIATLTDKDIVSVEDFE
jgi:hypothetical protein